MSDRDDGQNFVLVPRDPTPEMIVATWDHEVDVMGGIESQSARNARIYRAMLEAAPLKPLADIYETYKAWPADIRKKLSFHDLRRMSGWKPTEDIREILFSLITIACRHRDDYEGGEGSDYSDSLAVVIDKARELMKSMSRPEEAMSKSLRGSIEKLIVNVADGKIVSDEMTKVLADAQELEEAAEALWRAATLAGANVRLGRIRTILSKIQGR